MTNFAPHKITGFSYITLGLLVPFILTMSQVPFEEFLERVFDYYLFVVFTPLVPIVIGAAILKKMRAVAIFALILLPIFLLFSAWKITGFGLSYALDPWHNEPGNILSLLAITLTSLVLFILTLWSLKHLKKG